MIDVSKLLIQVGFEPDCASKQWHERMDRFAALLLEEAAKICVSQGKLPSSMWGEPGCWQHSADCCAQAILAAKPK